MDLRIPHQLFINNKFIDASDGKTFDTINPTDESVSIFLSRIAPENRAGFKPLAVWSHPCSFVVTVGC